MSAVPVMTAQDLELEHAELLPARETLWVSTLYPRHYPGPSTSIRIPLCTSPTVCDT